MSQLKYSYYSHKSKADKSVNILYMYSVVYMHNQLHTCLLLLHCMQLASWNIKAHSTIIKINICFPMFVSKQLKRTYAVTGSKILKLSVLLSPQSYIQLSDCSEHKKPHIYVVQKCIISFFSICTELLQKGLIDIQKNPAESHQVIVKTSQL